MYLVALELVAVLHLREIKDAREVEGVVHVEVDVEEWFAEVHRVERVVEVVVFLVLDVGRGFLPQWCHVVDDPRLLHLLGLGFAVLVGLALDFLLHLACTELDRDGQELAVFVEQFADTAFFEELGGIVGDVKDDVGAAVALRDFVHRVFGATVTFPDDAVLAFLVAGFRNQRHLRGDHEGGVEAQAKMSDDVSGFGLALGLELGDELLRAREGDLVDVLVDLFGVHADAAVAYGEGLFLLIHLHLDGEVAQFALELARGGEGFQLLRGVHGVADDFAQEDFLIRIEELLDDGENVFCLYSNVTGLHIVKYLNFKDLRFIIGRWLMAHSLWLP